MANISEEESNLLIHRCTDMMFNSLLYNQMLQPIPDKEATVKIKDYLSNMCRIAFFNLRACNGDADMIHQLVQETKTKSFTSSDENEQVDMYIQYCIYSSVSEVFTTDVRD